PDQIVTGSTDHRGDPPVTREIHRLRARPRAHQGDDGESRRRDREDPSHDGGLMPSLASRVASSYTSFAGMPAARATRTQSSNSGATVTARPSRYPIFTVMRPWPVWTSTSSRPSACFMTGADRTPRVP